MRDEPFEVAVVGFSVAGVAAALEASSLGRSVILVEHGWDSLHLGGTVLVGPTPLSGGAMVSGPGFADLAARALDAMGVEFELGRAVGALDEDRDRRLLLLAGGDGIVRAASILFAPCGSAPTVDPTWERFVGHGLSRSAWSDATLWSGAHIAIAGGGARALEEAYLAARWAARVTLLCPTGELSAHGLFAKLTAEHATVEILYNCVLTGATADPAGNLRELHFTESDHPRTLEIRALLLGGDAIIDWSLFPTESAARILTDGDRVVLAGLAMGIDPYDHDAQYHDGLRAAWAVSSGGT